MNLHPTPKRFLVLADGTEASFRAADHAIEIASAFHAALTAIAVVDTETLHQLLSARILVDAEMGELELELLQNAQSHLQEIESRARKRGIPIESVVCSGNTETILPREIHQRQIDLVAIGSFHSHDVTHDLLARQRQQILDHSPCCVLVVK
jgi:nucleotide-binding universal stress UspA family protein